VIEELKRVMAAWIFAKASLGNLLVCRATETELRAA
jgi:hypothetical protein